MWISRSAKWAGKLSFVTGSVAGSTGDPHFEIEKKKILRSHPSLLAEALFLVFAEGKETSAMDLFSRQRTPGKEPLLAGNSHPNRS